MTPNSANSFTVDTKQRWHIITPEYPPQVGGVSDYSLQVATGLRNAGDEVHVWCARPRDLSLKFGPAEEWVHWLDQGMDPAGLKQMGRQLDRFPAPRRLLVQWVPHGYGWQSMNLAFCLWLWKRAKSGDRVELMLHEAFLQFREGTLKQDVAAAVHRVMTMILLQAVSHVWMSTPSWEPMWRPYSLGRRVSFSWLPIPANIPVIVDYDQSSTSLTTPVSKPKQVIGHFSTHNKLITRFLDPVIPLLLRGTDNRILLLIGQGSERYREQLLLAHPDLANRIYASGPVEAAIVSRHLLTCDLLLQPYPEGITSRRTSAMAGLAHGIPVMSSSGPMTERIWSDSGAVILADFDRPAGIVQEVETLLISTVARHEIGHRGKLYYQQHFDARYMVRSLRKGNPTIDQGKQACCASQ